MTRPRPFDFAQGRHLVLVRHSTPDIRRDVPAREWRLSADGVARARVFSSRLPRPEAAALFTSVEPKAVETARTLAAEWHLAVEEVPGLHEHERPEAQMLTREAFEQKIRELFVKPHERVFGAETADHARRRFTMAVMRLVLQRPGDVLVVTHGTVMALFVAEAAGLDPFALWRRQEMPCAVTLALPELRVERTTTLSG